MRARVVDLVDDFKPQELSMIMWASKTTINTMLTRGHHGKSKKGGFEAGPS